MTTITLRKDFGYWTYETKRLGVVVSGHCCCEPDDLIRELHMKYKNPTITVEFDH